MRLVRVGEKTQAGGDSGPEWVDVDLEQPGAEAWLSERVDLSGATRELMAETGVNSRRVLVEEGLAMRVCYSGDEGEELGDESTVRVGLVIMGDRLLSVHRGSIREVDEVWHRVSRGELEVDHARKALALLLARIAERVGSQLDDSSSTLDALEDVVFDGGKEPPIEKLGQTRRRLIRDRRNISALSRTIEDVAAEHSGGMPNAVSDELSLAGQAMARHERTTAFHLERANLLQDQIQSQLSDRMNSATLRLGVVATVFLPLGFLTGLLGINVAGIPGTHDPEAFWLVCLLLTVLAFGAWFGIMRLYRT
ncbi:hypothetical protein MK280_12940 [Myxococcota bacterium]|nr:hypothetical protein [Myxococcota bacterium]